MAKVKIQGNAAGTGVFTIASPDSDTDRTITLPDSAGTLLDENSSLPAANLTGTVADARISALTSSKLTGNLPALNASSLTNIPAANITGTLPAISGASLTGIASNTHDFVADGTLPNGKPVILKTDGTVEVVTGTVVAESIPAAVAVEFESATVQWLDVAYDQQTAGKFVVVYQDDDNSDYGTACVGTVSGTTVSFGTPVVYESARTLYNKVSFNPNTANKCVVVYQDTPNSEYGAALVGTVSGTSISFGTSVVFESAAVKYVEVDYDHDSSVDKCAAVYYDEGNSNYVTVAVGTVSGTSISFGTPVVANAASSSWTSLAFDPNTAGKCLISYRNNSNYGAVRVGTLSGTSMTFGSEVVYNSGSTQFPTVEADPNNADKYVVAYRDDGDADKGKCIVATVSGTTPSFGTAVRFTDTTSDHDESLSFDPNNPNKFILGFKKGSTTQAAFAIVGTISGTVISFGTKYTMETADEQSYTKVAVDPNTPGQFIYCWRGGDPNRYGRARLGQIASSTTNLTTTNFIGTSTEAYSDTETATILLKGGISTNQSGLTTGTDYYVQGDGTLATSADTVSVKLGKALSSTAVLLAGE